MFTSPLGESEKKPCQAWEHGHEHCDKIVLFYYFQFRLFNTKTAHA